MDATLLDRKEGFAAYCLIAVGANLHDADGRSPRQACEHAAQEIGLLCERAAGANVASAVRAVRSRWFSTAPVPRSDQPRYINGMVRIWSRLQPQALLAALQAIELQAGRVRGELNAARTLDLDLIDIGGRVFETPELILPHPRAHLRAFVLLPLRDVAPDWVHPLSGETVGALVAALPPQDIRVL